MTIVRSVIPVSRALKLLQDAANDSGNAASLRFTPAPRARFLTCFVCKVLVLGLLWISPVLSRSQNVVADWDAISLRTIVSVGQKPAAGALVFFAYVNVAEYDAVNAIDHRHKPFAVTVDAPRGASVDAAVIASAHDILVHYFPAQEAGLDADQ